MLRKLLRSSITSRLPLLESSATTRIPNSSNSVLLTVLTPSPLRSFCDVIGNTTTSQPPPKQLDYETCSEETLESLCECFEEVFDSIPMYSECDVKLTNGVLTVEMPQRGTYVINKQSPNKQIWLSSPVSGPSRFDISECQHTWVYKHTGDTLHGILKRELQCFLDSHASDVDFEDCYMGRRRQVYVGRGRRR